MVVPTYWQLEPNALHSLGEDGIGPIARNRKIVACQGNLGLRAAQQANKTKA